MQLTSSAPYTFIYNLVWVLYSDSFFFVYNNFLGAAEKVRSIFIVSGFGDQRATIFICAL